MTLAQEYKALLCEETNAFLRYDPIKASQLQSERLAFENNYCIAVGDACIGTWESLTVIFVDGSVYVNSVCHYIGHYYTYS